MIIFFEKKSISLSQWPSEASCIPKHDAHHVINRGDLHAVKQIFINNNPPGAKLPRKDSDRKELFGCIL